MSVDYYLYSPTLKKKAMVGSISIAGTAVYGDALDFVRYCLHNLVTDIVMVSEDHPDLEWDENDVDPVPDYEPRGSITPRP